MKSEKQNRKRTKRILPVLLTALLMLSFTGCASRTTASSSSAPSAASEKPAQSASPETSKMPGSEAPNDSSVLPETALGLSAFRDALREAYGDKYYPDTKLTEDEIRTELGMDNTLYEEVYAENTAQKARPDTFIAVKVKEGKTDEVKEKLAAYKQRLLEDEDFAANKDKIEAAEIYADGDYVFFILLGEPETNGESQEGMVEAFGKEVQRGIDAIKKAIGME